MTNQVKPAYALHVVAAPGKDGLLTPLCGAAVELATGATAVAWLDDGPKAGQWPSPDVRAGRLIVHHSAAAVALWRANGWTGPVDLLDLHAEVRNLTNGLARIQTLADASAWYALPSVDAGLGCHAQALSRCGPTLGQLDRQYLLAHAKDCAEAIARLYCLCAPQIAPADATLRGAYSVAAAVIVARGLPLAVGLPGGVARAVNRMGQGLQSAGALLPVTYARHEPPRGSDGRCRPAIALFDTLSGRNGQGGDQLLGWPRWSRALLQPGDGRHLAILDWSNHELEIAAAASGDAGLLDLLGNAEDTYSQIGRALLAFAEVPPAAMRSRVKKVVLAWLNGAGAVRLEQLAGGQSGIGLKLAGRLQTLFPGIRRWHDAVADSAGMTGRLRTRFGWTWRPVDAYGVVAKPTTAINFPIQAAGADMMRIACVAASERGVKVLAPIHDAFLIEAASGGIGSAIARMRDSMDLAARWVLGGQRAIPVSVRSGGSGVDLLDAADREVWERLAKVGTAGGGATCYGVKAKV